MLMGFWIVAEAERRVMRMYQAGLVLEGGGMKGVYTAGVLDFLPKKELTSPISMGYLPERVICAAICPDKRGGH